MIAPWNLEAAFIMDNANHNARIPLPQFLKLLSNNNVPVTKAMGIAGKIYKEFNTPDALARLNDLKLKDLGIASNDDRKLVLSALAKEGYTSKPSPARRKVVLSPEADTSRSPSKQSQIASSSHHPRPLTTPSKPPKRKRKHNDDDEFLLSEPTQEDNVWDFKEVLDENVLKLKTCVINRAPVMMAWSMLVAEKMHFSRSESLSIASVYTEMNAVSKGVSLGIYRADEERGREAAKGGSQPYVDLIGRKVPLYQTQQGQWRALSNGNPAHPKSAFDYITCSFRQTSPFVMGALKLLADSYSPTELNKKAWSLYAEFRPEVNEWGKRSEVHCSKILDLRKKQMTTGQHNVLATEVDRRPEVSYESTETSRQDDEPQQKKIKSLTLEEYEALLDPTFDVDLKTSGSLATSTTKE